MENFTLKVMLVDNSKVFKGIFEEAFAGTHFIPVAFETGNRALQELQREKYALVCSAMYLSDMEGIALCHAMRQLPGYAYTPFNLFTSADNPSILKQALPAGVTDIFRKPEIQELINSIKRYPFKKQPIQGRVLYVEDGRAQRECIQALFQEYGLEVDAYSSADEAWPAFLKRTYDLVVTDIVLEGSMSGLVFVNNIRRLGDVRGDVPILAITAFDDPSRRIQLLSLGVTDYVIKPVIEEELIARVRNLITNHRLLLEVQQQKTIAESSSAAKTEFLSFMSHELRTPLNAVIGFSQLLLDESGAPLSHDQQEFAQRILKGGEHLLNLINDILDLAKIESGRVSIVLDNVNLDDLMLECITTVQPLADKMEVRIATGPEDEGGPVIVRADRTRLKQVLLNLISNAVKYNQFGGSVDIRVERPLPDTVRVSVSDTGLGIPAERLPELFKPFSRLGKERSGIEGTGIGLNITQKLVHQMNGRIGAESTVGTGSVFWLELPAANSGRE